MIDSGAGRFCSILVDKPCEHHAISNQSHMDQKDLAKQCVMTSIVYCEM